MKSRVDDNQHLIIEALEKIGCSVRSLASLGHGIPDILVGLAGKNYLIEIKNGENPLSKQKLTPDQEYFHSVWQGQKAVVNNINDALDIVTLKKVNKLKL